MRTPLAIFDAIGDRILNFAYPWDRVAMHLSVLFFILVYYLIYLLVHYAAPQSEVSIWLSNHSERFVIVSLGSYFLWWFFRLVYHAIVSATSQSSELNNSRELERD